MSTMVCTPAQPSMLYVESANSCHGHVCSAERAVRNKPAEAMAVKEMQLTSDLDKCFAVREVAALRAIKTKLQKMKGPHHILEYVDHYHYLSMARMKRSSLQGACPTCESGQLLHAALSLLLGSWLLLQSRLQG